MTRHNCARDGWPICCVCRGRIHLDGCTTRRDPQKDCCEARHRQLHDAGHADGLDDAALPMYDRARPTWATT